MNWVERNKLAKALAMWRELLHVRHGYVSLATINLHEILVDWEAYHKRVLRLEISRLVHGPITQEFVDMLKKAPQIGG